MVLLSVEFFQKAKATKNPLNTDEMAQQFAMKHIEQPVQLHQRVTRSQSLCDVQFKIAGPIAHIKKIKLQEVVDFRNQ